ncbi:nucleoside/nucleotide kinase family protein [Flammeovirga aprica]|uniref:Uridine kinase n=1 Tax=Flammeovirga aprica JL-4 TaxID=694437 RepID=A0A7X9RZY6_9BACT|nr:uridine kinase [Flammeovirga aprica]NME71838.1 uridine kinase [Flammeovirga aprica JL-4]
MNNLFYTLQQKAKYHRPLMVGISGIDGSGKGYIGQKLFDGLISKGIKCELIGIDGWLEKPSRRFSKENPAEHFYRKSFRFEEMNEKLIKPLKQDGKIDFIAQHSAPDHSEELIDFHYDINDVEILLVEGIFLFQEQFDFDYRIWIECSFETAFERALVRNQEGLSEEALKEEYDTTYFPAQHLHFENDNPKDKADFILINDHLLEK